MASNSLTIAQLRKIFEINDLKVSNQSRELSAENFSRWMKSMLKQYIFAFIDSSYSVDKMKGLVVITQLIGVTPPDVLNILVIYFRITLKSNDKDAINLSAKGLVRV